MDAILLSIWIKFGHILVDVIILIFWSHNSHFSLIDNLLHVILRGILTLVSHHTVTVVGRSDHSKARTGQRLHGPSNPARFLVVLLLQVLPVRPKEKKFVIPGLKARRTPHLRVAGHLYILDIALLLPP